MLKIIQNGKIQEIAALSDKSVLAALQAAGLTGVHAPCGGNGTCKQCTAHITGRLLPVGGGEAIEAENEALLCCRWIPDGDVQVILPDTEKLDVLTAGAGNIRPCGENSAFLLTSERQRLPVSSMISRPVNSWLLTAAVMSSAHMALM